MGGCDRSLCSKPSAGDTLNLVGTRRGVDNKLAVSQAVTGGKIAGPLVFSRFPAIAAHRLFARSNIVAAEFPFSFSLIESTLEGRWKFFAEATRALIINKDLSW